jgi:hypothetical protein
MCTTQQHKPTVTGQQALKHSLHLDEAHCMEVALELADTRHIFASVMDCHQGMMHTDMKMHRLIGKLTECYLRKMTGAQLCVLQNALVIAVDDRGTRTMAISI